MLGTLVLALNNDAGRQMGDADGRRSLVDVLAAGAAGAVGIDAQVVWVDLDVNILLDVRHHVGRAERCLALARRVERRDADQAVNAVFAAKQSVHVIAVDLKRHSLDAGLIAFLVVQNLIAETVLVGPARVHAIEHGAPVHGLRAAGAGVKRQDRIVGIIRSREQRLNFHALQLIAEVRDRLLDVAGKGLVILFLGHLDHRLQIFQSALQAVILGKCLFQRIQLLHGLLGLFRVVPEALLLHVELHLLDLALLRVQIQ